MASYTKDSLELMNIVGNNIQDRRKECHLSQSQLGKAIGSTQSYISTIENGSGRIVNCVKLSLKFKEERLMTFNAMTERYEEITVCGKPALFTSIRIKRDTVPDGLYAYDVRHDDECRGIPCEIAPFVMVNHWGTIILAEPLELPDDGRRYIDEDTDWNYAPFGGTEKNQKPCVTVKEFIKTYVKQK